MKNLYSRYSCPACLKITFPVLLAFFLLTACHQGGLQSVNKTPVARVGSRYLYREDIPGNFVTGISQEDSSKFIENYINRWIKNQLLAQKADLYLPEEQKEEIERQVEEARLTLLVYHYEQDLILQKMDTSVADTVIENFYEKQKDLYALDYNIVKALFIKIPITAPDISKARRWYRSDRDDDYTKLESYCYQYAAKFDDFNDQWILFDLLLKEVPLTISNQERYLRYNPFIEAKDSAYQYFVRINEYRLRGMDAPIEYVADRIRQIILNERKIKFIRELENNIYSEALNLKEIEIYK
ncbi:MAG TPA: hypothetical protein ENK25_10125 [Bacteroidetes bacterium]|nr:hypothetical protein [Bacteroidota bacterium]